tara:strand:- start:2150 stop:2281 length:132 start_codon:yes stop_codon:yes gene_type:complete
MGGSVIVALATGFDTLTAILVAAAFGFVLAIAVISIVTPQIWA